MRVTWEDRKHHGRIDDHLLQEKPQFSFEYAWFLVTDTTAQYVESHEYGYWNKDMTEEQRQEVVDFYNSWEPPEPEPVVEPEYTEEELLQMKREGLNPTRRQFMQQLVLEGLDEDAEALIESIPDATERKLMWIWYKDSQVFERLRPELIDMAAKMGKTPEELDLFMEEAMNL